MRYTLTLLALAGIAPAVQASCGSMMCDLNPAWDTQAMTHDHGLRMDVRYSYAKADTLRSGTGKVTPPVPSNSDEEIENLRTLNQSVVMDLDYALDRHWSVAVQFPWAMRDHAHTLDPDMSPAAPSPFVEQAKYSALGDMRVTGKYRFMSTDHQSGGGVRLGLKLPTGATNKEMAPGTPMEASLQPGSGSTDLILGGYVHWSMPGSQWGGYAQAQLQSAVADRNNYRPGNSLSVDVGAHRPLGDAVTGILQLSYLQRGHDGGANANGANSGGRSWFLSPGLSVSVAPGTHLYGLVQLPISQYVNGEQLTAKWQATLGLSKDL